MSFKEKRTMTLNLSPAEMEALEALCKSKSLSKTALVKQALRLYQSVEDRLEKGDKLFLESQDKKEKSEIMVL